MINTTISDPIRAWLDIKQHIRHIVVVADARNVGWKTGAANTNTDQLLALISEIRRRIDVIQAKAQTPGIVAAIRAVEQDPAYTPGPEFAEFRARVVAVRGALRNALPRNADGRIDEKDIDADGVPVFTHPAQANLDVVTAAIDNLSAFVTV